MNSSQPAFPNKDEIGNMIPGLTKREYAAIEIFKAMVSNPFTAKTIFDSGMSIEVMEKKLRSTAIRNADALLAELEKGAK